MATGTNIRYTVGRSQYQGVFESTLVIRFTLDTASLSPNASVEDTVAVPGLNPSTDVVLGYSHTPEPLVDLIQEVHAGTNELHVVSHNASGGAINPASTDFVVVIGRIHAGA